MMFHQGIFASVAAREGHEQGWQSCFERLEALLHGAQRMAEA